MPMSTPDRAGSAGRSVLILGGTSAIGAAIAEALVVQQSGAVVVAARDLDRAAAVGEQLRSAGATDAFTIRFDGSAVHDAQGVVAEAAQLLGRVDIAVVAFGAYIDSAGLAGDLDAALALVQLNLQGAIAAGEALAGVIRAQGSGRIIAVSSRPHAWTRENASVYAASKAGFDAYFAGLGSALRKVGGDVLVIRPPGVNTPLIENHSSFLSPDEVAVEALRAFSTGLQELTILTHEEQRLAERSLPRKIVDRSRHELARLRRSVRI
jgi:decaprenylphospho-beta-D-erythro-pentofuranosid-2-ulose 2-reductase